MGRSRPSMLSNRNLRRRDLIRAGGLAGAGLAALAIGCGARQTVYPGSSNSSTAGKPQTGGKFSIAVTTDPVDWDVTYTGKTPPANDGLGLIYESLLGF